jgi:RimJ/RimL family protein N-acetyltransferase
MIAPTITTERLTLRAADMVHYKLLLALYQSDRCAFIGGKMAPADVWRGFMNMVGHWAINGFGGWSIVLAQTGEIIGEVAITQPPEYPELELGWALFAGHEGKGYALEAATAALDFARDTLHAPHLVSYIDPDNARSIRLALRLGAQLDEHAATPNNDPCLVYRH